MSFETGAPGYSEGTHHFMVELNHEDIDNSPVAPATDQDVENIQTEIVRKREALLAELTPDEEGLELRRVTDFMEGQGLEVVPFIVIGKDQKPRVSEILGRSVDDVRGLYLSTHDLAIAYRDHDAETFNGPEFTESVLIHELGHGSSRQKAIVAATDIGGELQVMHSRLGHHILDEGTFFEEAFAAQLQHRYIWTALGKPNGFTGRASAVRYDMGFIDWDKALMIPAKYRSHGETIEDQLNTPDLAAFGMELMMLKDPTIWESMLKARNDIAGLREVAQKVEALSPGLYTQLRGLQCRQLAFYRGTQLLVSLLYENSPSEAAAASVRAIPAS